MWTQSWKKWPRSMSALCGDIVAPGPGGLFTLTHVSHSCKLLRRELPPASRERPGGVAET